MIQVYGALATPATLTDRDVNEWHVDVHVEVVPADPDWSKLLVHVAPACVQRALSSH